MGQEYLYSAFNRFWHWSQAALILFLAATGFEIHGSFHFFGYADAVRYHSAAAMSLLVLVAFAIFWHFTTGQWRQYMPTLTHARDQVRYYLVGIFQGAPHPPRRAELGRLNPLQRLVYLGLKLLIIPTMATSGLLYMFYRYPQRHEILSLNMSGLRSVALVHTLGAYLILAFLVAHVYLITTGKSLGSNLKAMVTGYDEKDADPAAPSQAH